MLRKNYLLLTCLILVHFIQTSYSAKQHQNPDCKPSSCGNIHNISYPFRLKDDPKDCGDPNYEISCENNTTPSIYMYSHKYHVRAIDYQNSTIRVAYASIKNNVACSIPLYYPNWSIFMGCSCSNTGYRMSPILLPITFITCPFTLNDSLFTETDQCVNRNHSRSRHTYIKVGPFNASYVGDMCTIRAVVMTSFPFKNENNISLAEIHDALLYGFELPWSYCPGNHCGEYERGIMALNFLQTFARNFVFFNQSRQRRIAFNIFLQNFHPNFKIPRKIRKLFVEISKICYYPKTKEINYTEVVSILSARKNY